MLTPVMPTNRSAQAPLRSKVRAQCSTSLNRRSKNVIVEAILVPKLELRNVKMQVFLAHVVESADDAALEDRPEASIVLV